jgi:hypothetical protein
MDVRDRPANFVIFENGTHAPEKHEASRWERGGYRTMFNFGARVLFSNT